MISTTEARLKMDDGIVMQLGTKLYTQPTWWVLIKELLQNAMDANATEIKINTNFSDYIDFKDNGCGMTEDQLLNTFLTVGGTDKNHRENTIGGFGIAKLAIFSCDNFTVQSGHYALTKDILLNHKPLEFNEYAIPGTFVSVHKNNLFSWAGVQDLMWYLGTVDRDITIFLNEEEISPFPVRTSYLSEYGEVKSVESQRKGNYEILVRLNGLPLFKQWITGTGIESFPGELYLFDVESDLSPYDEEYPFNVTRESFTEGSAYAEKLACLSKNVFENIRDAQNIEEVKKRAVYKVESHGIWSMYNPNINDQSLKVLKEFRKYIEILFMLDGREADCEFGLLGANNEYVNAAYSPGEGDRPNVFYVSDSVKQDPATLAALAIHEYTHVDYRGHYEEFANAMTQNVRKWIKFMKNAMEIAA